MDYQVHFSLTIRSFDGKTAAFLSKQMSLPFVPFIGLRLAQANGASEPVVSVAWDEVSQSFQCHIDAHEAEMPAACRLGLDYLVQAAKDNGWQGAGKIYELAAG
ncbi:hypothetical protein [Shewanella sedimentimangrovi]|uniref:Antibiotic biosynthesis monooxygenase n=1 Tax=Shewanella sedimentimangrovi TaxID=2814293 RepID=A0ABX7R0C9_9GAMM|nr:hypothetical protein [Shewanella sedimentimangrovi]QSX36949.1 hypothetical protein JYB85_17065 [Shewanella sedimentimangrovi]